MKQIFRLSAACALLIAAPALAADYDPPIYIEQAPEYVPVEIGSGWYLRGDISYNAGKPVYDVSFPGINHRRFGVGAGVGYHFSDNFRGDVMINYLGGDRFSYADPFIDVEASYGAWNGLVSGYYDIATVVGITPYVGAGIGLTYSRQKVDASLTSNGTTFDLALADRSYDFAYALMAGAAYKVSDNVSVDLGYQFLHTPDAKYLDVNTPAIRKGTKHHLVRLGLRYDLW